MWSAPRCRSRGLACGCEFDSSSGVKLADERNKQSGATAARVGEPAGLARARDRSRNHGRNLAQIGSLGTYSLGAYTEGKGSGHGKVSRCGAGRRAGHRWCGLCHVLRRMRRLSRAGWSWWLRADAGLLCWWAAERGARYGTSGITLTGPGAVLAVPSSRRRSGWRGYSDTTGPTTRQPWPRHRGKRSGSERRRQCHTGSHDHGDNLRLRSSGTTVSLPRRRASSSSGQLAFASLTRTRVPRPARHASGRREASSLRPQTLLVLVCSRPGRFTNPGRIDHSRKGLRSWRGSLLGYSPWPSCLAFPAAPGQRPIAIIRQE